MVAIQIIIHLGKGYYFHFNVLFLLNNYLHAFPVDKKFTSYFRSFDQKKNRWFNYLRKQNESPIY